MAPSQKAKTVQDTNSSDKQASATPELREHPFTGESILAVDWGPCLDNPGPTNTARAGGHKVYVIGAHHEWSEGPAMHVLQPTGFGLPEPWDTIMVALGLRQNRNLLYSLSPAAISNGHIFFFTDDSVAKAAASCPSTRIPDGAVGQVTVGCEFGEEVELAAARCFSASGAFVSSVARIGDAFVDVRYVAAAIASGATTARSSGELTPVSFDGGVMMPVRISDEERERFMAVPS